MATDVVVSRELKSLQDEISAAKTQRAATVQDRLHFGAVGPANRCGAVVG
jgi:hypothetical protein